MISNPVWVSVNHAWGLTSASLQEAKKEYIIAILFAPSWEPTNKKFFLPRTRGRILFSLALLTGWILLSSKKGSLVVYSCCQIWCILIYYLIIFRNYKIGTRTDGYTSPAFASYSLLCAIFIILLMKVPVLFQR